MWPSLLPYHRSATGPTRGLSVCRQASRPASESEIALRFAGRGEPPRSSERIHDPHGYRARRRGVPLFALGRSAPGELVGSSARFVLSPRLDDRAPPKAAQIRPASGLVFWIGGLYNKRMLRARTAVAIIPCGSYGSPQIHQPLVARRFATCDAAPSPSSASVYQVRADSWATLSPRTQLA